MNKARCTSSMTISASDANELLCDNNTVKTRHVNRSDFLKKTWLSRLFLEVLINFVANKKNCFLLKILSCLFTLLAS